MSDFFLPDLRICTTVFTGWWVDFSICSIQASTFARRSSRIALSTNANSLVCSLLACCKQERHLSTIGLFRGLQLLALYHSALLQSQFSVELHNAWDCMLLLKCWIILPCLQMAVLEKLHYELSNSCLPAKSTKHAWRVCGLLIHVWGQCPRQWWHMDQVLIKRYASQAISASSPNSIGLLKRCICHCNLVSVFVRNSHLQETNVVPSTSAYRWCNWGLAQYSCKSRACGFPFWTLPGMTLGIATYDFRLLARKAHTWCIGSIIRSVS